MTHPHIPGFRKVPRTGVIYVMHRAQEMGYRLQDNDWVNLGQGAPQTNHIPGSCNRIKQLTIDMTDHEYAPVTGQKALCQKVADLYNTLYRKGKKSQYTWENVSISGGGRVALTRIVAALGNINMGHFLPDYTAYEELLSIFKAFIPIPILLSPEFAYKVPIEQIKKEIMGRGLQALLMSNPCNPTGQVIKGELLNEWVQLAKSLNCSLILDEFYSHYIYDTSNNAEFPQTNSAAQFVDDVNQDPVIIVDGLTKNWRYPGWRISWTLAPKEVIENIASAGSFLDGGASNPFQTEVVRLLDPSYVKQEAQALQQCFQEKRDYALHRLAEMDIQVEVKPEGAFYIWANLSALPKSIRDGMAFFEAGLTEKVITVPGVFFDVNPEKRRSHAQYSQYIRISFGPEMSALEKGLNAIERVIQKAS
ncbi:MAG: pyridoxal phosphate-dependent aminotransferase [Candidatus Berkiella sp.]